MLASLNRGFEDDLPFGTASTVRCRPILAIPSLVQHLKQEKSSLPFSSHRGMPPRQASEKSMSVKTPCIAGRENQATLPTHMILPPHAPPPEVLIHYFTRPPSSSTLDPLVLWRSSPPVLWFACRRQSDSNHGTRFMRSRRQYVASTSKRKPIAPMNCTSSSGRNGAHQISTRGSRCRVSISQ